MRTAGHIRRLALLYSVFARRALPRLLPRLAVFAWRRWALRRGVPVTVMISVTGRCQCRCAHCSASGMPAGPELSTEELKSVISDAAAIGSPKIGLTGGEPLLRPDIKEIVAHAAALGLSVSIDTNGLLLDGAMIAALKEAGLCNVNVSLDAPDARRHDRLRGAPGCHAAALEAVRLCAPAGLPCVVSTYVTDRAMESGRLRELIKLARGAGASAVRVMFPIYTGRLGGRRRTLLSPENKRLFFRDYADPAFVYSESPLYDYLDGAVRCTAAGKLSVYVGADGAVRSCYSASRPLGSVRDGGLRALLERSGYLSSGPAAAPDCGAC